MKKILFALVSIGLVAVMALVLMNNKAKSDAKAKVPPPKAIAVTVAPIGRQTLSGDLSLVGTVVANREVTIAAETQGRVLAVGPKVGDHVSAGQLLARVDAELKEAALANAQVNYDKAKKDLERYEWMQSQNDGGIADIQVENARQTLKATEAAMIVAKRQYRDTRVTAPISGVIVARPIEIGTTLLQGNPVATIVDVSQLKVKVNVPEADVFKLHMGDVVKITTDVYPGVSFEAHISMIGVRADEAHTYPVEVTLRNNAQFPLRAGMFGRVSFISLPSKSVPVVPREAIVGSIKKPQVFVVSGKTAKLRDIVVGAEAGTSVEILNGLSEGDRVVVGGQNNLRDGSEINIIAPATAPKK